MPSYLSAIQPWASDPALVDERENPPRQVPERGFWGFPCQKQSQRLHWKRLGCCTMLGGASTQASRWTEPLGKVGRLLLFRLKGREGRPPIPPPESGSLAVHGEWVFLDQGTAWYCQPQVYLLAPTENRFGNAELRRHSQHAFW